MATNEFDQYTIKYNSQFKDFRDSALPKVGRGGILGVAGAVAGAGLSIVLPFGAVVCAGVGFALAGPVSQVAYSSVYSAKNLSNKHFSKVKLPLDETVANGLSSEDEAKRNILAVKKIAEACDTRARNYMSVLNTTAGTDKYTIVDDNGKTIEVGERKLKKLIKENEEVARHALDYVMGVAIEQSNRYRAIDAGTSKVADKQTAMEFCMYMLQTAGQTASNLVQNRRTLGEANPYKGTILRAMENKALIGTVNGRLQTLPSKNITHANPSFNERIELNAGNTENLLVIYNEMFETSIRKTLQREEEEKNAEQVRIDVEVRNQIRQIEQYIKTLKQGENYKQAKSRLDVYLRNNLDVAVLIGIAQRVKARLPLEKQADLDTAIATLVDANSDRKVAPIAHAKLTLATLIEEAYGVIEDIKFNEGAKSRQAEIDELLGKLTAGEIKREHLSSLVTAYTRIIDNLKRANAEEKANAEAEYLKLKTAYEASGTKNAQLEQIIAQLENALSSTKRDLHLRNQENLQKARQVIGARNDKIAELNNNVLEQAQQIKLLIKESEGKTLSIESLKQAITTLTTQLSTAVQNSKDDKKVIDEFRTEIQDLSAELEALKISNPRQKKQIEELQTLLARKEIELKNAMSASKKYQGTTAEARKSNAELNKTIASQNSEIAELNSTIENLSDSLAEAWDSANANKVKVYNSCVKAITALKAQVQELRKSNRASQQQVAELNAKIAELEQNAKDLKNEVIAERERGSQNLKVATDKLNEQQREKTAQQQAKEKMLKGVIEKLRKNLNKRNIDIQDLQHLMAELKAQNEASETQNLELQERIDELAGAIADKERELENFKASVVDALNRYRHTSQETIAMQYDQFASVYKQMGIHDDRAEELLGQLRETMEKAHTASPVTNDTVISGIKEMWGENFALLIQNTEMYEDIMKRLREQFETANTKAKKQAERARKAEKRAKSTKAQLTEERSRFERELAEVTADNDVFRSALENTHAEIDSINQLNADITDRYVDAESARLGLAETNAKLSKELNAERTQRAKAEAGRSKAERDVSYFAAEALREMDRANSAIEGAEEMHEHYVKVVDGLYGQIDELLTEVADKDYQIRDLNDKVTDLTDTYVHPTAEIQFAKAKKSLQTRCEELRHSINSSIRTRELEKVLEHAQQTLFAIDAMEIGDITYDVRDEQGRRERYYTDEEISAYTKTFRELSKNAKELADNISKLNAKAL